ncbi:MAG: dTDP-4-dehydrorhamnose reductase [Bacteroidota bacterium]
MPIKVVVIGANGQLGKSIQFYLDAKPNNADFYFFSRTDLDISNEAQMRSQLETIVPDYILNCSAYTAVDKAETESEQADLINHQAIINLAQITNELQATLIHISTDFVFDGSKNTPLVEEDICNPIGVYGLTKYAGEQAIASNTNKYFIIRTSWLYSNIGANFFTNITKYATDRDALNVVYDQVGTPTLTYDLVKAILQLIEQRPTDYGIYHFSNEGVCSWYDFATELVSMQHITCNILPILSAQYPTPAKRPAYSVLNKNKIKTLLGITIPHWRESLYKLIHKQIL